MTKALDEPLDIHIGWDWPTSDIENDDDILDEKIEKEKKTNKKQE